MTRPRFAHLVARFREMGEPVTTEESDAAFAAAILRPDELALWMRMDPRDRRHAVAVTKRFVGACPGAVREEVAGALMHDIGKSQVSMGRVARSVATIVALTPTMRRYRAAFEAHDVAVSLGWSLVAPGDEPADAAFQRADAAMYEDKQARRSLSEPR